MERSGFRILSMEPIDVPFDQVAQISCETLYAHVKRLYRKNPSADGVYLKEADGRPHVSSPCLRRISEFR